MLLGSLPQDLKSEIVIAGELTTVKILYKILKSYQLGGQGEKAQLLQALTAAKPGKTAQEAIEGFISWQRRYVRAKERVGEYSNSGGHPSTVSHQRLPNGLLGGCCADAGCCDPLLQHVAGGARAPAPHGQASARR